MTIRMLLIALCLGFGSLIGVSTTDPETLPQRAALASVPMQLEEWRGRSEPAYSAEILSVLQVHDYLNRVYYDGSGYPARLYIGYYERQRQGATMHSPLNCLPGTGWQIERSSPVAIPVSAGPSSSALPTRSVEVKRLVIRKGVERQLVYYWYQSHGRVVASEYWSKIYTVLDAVRLNRTDAAMVRIVTPIVAGRADGEDVAGERSIALIQSLFPHLQAVLPS